ncbi:unnamed protein product [Sphagnum balticum]
MGQELVVTEHQVLSETNVRVLAAKQVERSKSAAPISQSSAVKPMQKERECTPLSQNNSTKPMYTVSSRQCISGHLNFSSKSSSSCHSMSGDMTMVPPKAENVKIMSKEEKKTVQKKGQRSNRSKTGVTMAEKLQGGRNNSGKRRPTASIAWDSLNRSRESSPQHELAAIPFKWEEAPGKPKEEAHLHVTTIAEAAERAMARRILQGVERSHRQEVLLQKRIAAQVVMESLSDHEKALAKVKLQECQALGEHSRHSSFGSSHRFYARKTGSGLEQSSRFQGLRLSVDGDGHVISEMETGAHIDLVAPAAAKFLVDNCVSPNGTTEKNLTRIPFEWEEAPGKPKFDDTADAIPKKLQLPPRLVAAPTQKLDFMSQDVQDQQRLRSMSGPLMRYYPLSLSNHSSPARTRPHQHSHPVMRSCSPSKRSSSPSKIQALAKKLSRKVSSTALIPDMLHDEQSWQGARRDPSPSKRSISPSRIQALAKHLASKVSNTGSAPNQGSNEDELFWQTKNPSPSKSPISPLKMQAFAMHLSHKVSGMNTVAQESSYEDHIWTAQHSLHLERHISPSKIHALAKHLSQKISNTAAPENNPYDNPSWQQRNIQHSLASGYHSGPLEGHHNRAKGGGNGYGSFLFERSSLGASSLQVNSEQDYNWAAGHKQASSQHSWNLESSTTSLKNSISPSMRSFSPSRIHSSAKLLTKKVMSPQDTAIKDPNWHTFTTSYDSGPLERCTDQTEGCSSSSLERSSSDDLFGPPSSILQSSEIFSSEAWVDKQPQGLHHPWSPTSIFHGPSGNSEVPTDSVPSSGSDIDTHIQTAMQPSVMLSKSLSGISYESFEHYFEELHSPTSSHPPQWEADNNSSVSSPYLGPTSANYAAQESGGRAASDGVKAIIKLCRAGSKWRKSKKCQNPEIWAPTLATYFQCVEPSATISGQINTARSCPKDNKNEHMDSGSSLMESPEAATRLPYKMPSVVEQETVGSELCDSSSTHYTSCLGLISPAIFISRAENRSYSKGTLAWGGRIPVSSASTNNSEEGYRSPAYTATLELLSPSTKLISKKVLGKSQSITRGLSSSNIHNKLIDAMCKSLKRSIYNCAKRCCHSTKLRLHEDHHQFPPTGFNFCKKAIIEQQPPSQDLSLSAVQIS